MPLMCLVCAAAFEATRRDARYCSPRCRVRAQRARQVAKSTAPRSETIFADAVKAELAELPPALRSSGLALLASGLADFLDVAPVRDASSLARELRATMADLRALADGTVEEADIVDDLLARRTRSQG